MNLMQLLHLLDALNPLNSRGHFHWKPNNFFCLLTISMMAASNSAFPLKAISLFLKCIKCWRKKVNTPKGPSFCSATAYKKKDSIWEGEKFKLRVATRKVLNYFEGTLAVSFSLFQPPKGGRERINCQYWS